MNSTETNISILQSLKGKVVYVEITGTYFHGFADLGLVESVTEEKNGYTTNLQIINEIEIRGEYDDFTLSNIGLKISKENDLEEDEDTFLFKATYPLSSTKLYFFEYIEE